MKRAITIGSLSSVSIHPPLISVCLQTPGRMSHIVQNAKKFSVHVLKQDQSEIARKLAHPPDDEMEYWNQCMECVQDTEYFRLKECLANMHCTVENYLVAGDHMLFIGKVEAFSMMNEKEIHDQPLIYFDRKFHCINNIS